MSINILNDYIKACRILGVEPTWKGLNLWRKEMYNC